MFVSLVTREPLVQHSARVIKVHASNLFWQHKVHVYQAKTGSFVALFLFLYVCLKYSWSMFMKNEQGRQCFGPIIRGQGWLGLGGGGAYGCSAFEKLIKIISLV